MISDTSFKPYFLSSLNKSIGNICFFIFGCFFFIFLEPMPEEHPECDERHPGRDGVVDPDSQVAAGGGEQALEQTELRSPFAGGWRDKAIGEKEQDRKR